jgi:hydroxylamine reductase
MQEQRATEDLAMFCYQCEMSSPQGCGALGQKAGTCGKDATLARLQDMMVFGAKGLSAYRSHAKELGADTAEVDDALSEALYFTLTNVNFSLDQHIAQLMKLGQAGLKVMDLLSKAHTETFGVPKPVSVPWDRAEGKAILVSGHNLFMLGKLLEATKGLGVNIYTHSEMLPAHAYPELKAYPHLKGHIGKAWFDQSELFERWQGAIVINTNCIVPLKKHSGYAKRLFGYKLTSVEGIRHIQGDDFGELIQTAMELSQIQGFDSEATITTGHHYLSLLDSAPDILEAVNKGLIRRFFVIAGCDAPGQGGTYFRDMALSLPKDCLVITSSCGKFRFADGAFGTIPGTAIPRYLDLGQCNDSNGAVHIALALSEALGVTPNDLPVSIVLSWMEQKAIIILLALLSLGLKNITLGPKPPQFLNAKIAQFLKEQFGLRLTNGAKEDLRMLLVSPSA